MTDAKWNVLSPEAKSRLIEKQKAEKAAKETVAGKTEISSEDKKNKDDCFVGSTKAWQIYRRTMKDLSNN